MEITKTLAKKVLKVVDAGLVNGLGKPIPGKMCVEAAVNYAMGLPHGDKPECVGELVRDFKISLNDCAWPTDADRTKGMRKLAIAQLGSDTIDQKKFLEKVGLKVMTRVLPVALVQDLKLDHPDAKKIAALAEKLKKAKTYRKAGELATESQKMLWDASAYAYASAYLKANPTFALTIALTILNLTAECGLEALIELKSPGCEFLGLCK